jgi:sec-independent protein translocase protein TatA
MTSALLTPSHVAILLVVVLLLFGAKRVPKTGRALGTGIREFTDAIAASRTENSTGSADQEDTPRHAALSGDPPL